VEFKTLFPILRKHLSDGYDVPQFFRDLMAMLTEVSEDEWGTSKDPSQKGRDNSLRSYAKRGLPKKLARTIVYRLTPENVVDSINSHKEEQRRNLANDLVGFEPSLDVNNVAKWVADQLVEIVQRSAGLVSQDKLSKEKQQQLDLELKQKYGDYLLAEEDNHCAFPGCGRELVLTNNGKISYAYEVSLINKNEKASPENLLAMCPQCHATYLMDSDKKVEKQLLNVKKLLATHRQSVHLLDDLPLESGIISVITRISKLKEKDLADASLDPKEIKQKLDPARDTAIYFTVKGYVSIYFVKIREIMTNLDKRREIDYDEIQDQMHALYRRLKKAGKSRLEIFNEITDKVHRVSLADNVYCQIVVAYFIQSCEVFDAITK
jgi:hypothetical protein